MTSSKRMMATAVVLATCTACTSALAESPRQFSGVAAFYSTNYSGRTACGERYDPKKYTAAHRSLPFGTRLRITDPRSQRSVIVWSMTVDHSREVASSTSHLPPRRPCT